MGNAHLTEQELKTILVNQQYVSEEDFETARSYAEKSGNSLIQYLLDIQAINQDIFGQAVSEYYGVRYIDFDAHAMTTAKCDLLPGEIARRFRTVAAYEEDKIIYFATDKPVQDGLHAALSLFHPDRDIVIGYALSDGIDEALFFYRDTVGDILEQILEKDPEDAPRVVDTLFDEAVARRVSDMHFEPRKEDVVVRFRVDGVLEEVVRLSHDLYAIVLNRIKVASDLRIDRHFTSQDGSLHHETDNVSVDMRISIVPITHGEKIVIRILGEYVKGLSLSQIGMGSHDQALMEEAARKPFGMILVTGPTGSGKTTTLYSLVTMLNNAGVNITTIEDPVEYKIPGINQIQVNEQVGLDFSRGLRSIVRQDPDVILVGEIRDKETAEIAINAALTGHLVLSTFHANDAATAIPRLIDMGIEPFLLASTLEMVIGQRLVRVLRQDERISKTYDRAELISCYPQLEHYYQDGLHTMYEPADEDGNAYRGRIGVFELLPVGRQIEELIMQEASATELRQRAQEVYGMRSMLEDGIDKLKLGVTAPKELLRVVQPPNEL